MVRLFILGALAAGGPMHGYQIRQEAVRDQAEWWSDVKPGSLYSALHLMARDGLVEVARTETPAASPLRTIYRITRRGRQELAVQRDEALRRVVFTPDPLDLALRYVTDLSTDQLVDVIRTRHAVLVQRLALHEDAYADSEPHLVGLEPITFRHVLQRLRAELEWHEQLLAELTATRSGPDPPQGHTSAPTGTQQV